MRESERERESEGVESTSIPEKMLSTVQWSAISTQVRLANMARVRSKRMTEGIRYDERECERMRKMREARETENTRERESAGAR